MLQNAGYAPQAFPTWRLRLLLLARLGSPGAAQSQPDRTGSTSDGQNLPSPKRLAACLHDLGGRTTPANLFFNLATKAVGILGTAQGGCLRRDRPHDVRRQGRHRVDAQRLHGERPVQPWRTELCRRCQPRVRRKSGCAGRSTERRYRHLFQPLPAELIDAAFIDRLHGYLPGWEVPRSRRRPWPTASASSPTTSAKCWPGCARKTSSAVRELPLAAGMTQRDQVAVAG